MVVSGVGSLSGQRSGGLWFWLVGGVSRVWSSLFGVPWWSVVVVVLVSSIVIRDSQDGLLDSGSWVRVPPWWVVLERSSWGSPFPLWKKIIILMYSNL